MNDFVILAIDAAQRTAAEEHGARAARAADAGLLVEMQRRPRDDGAFPHPAEALALAGRFAAALRPALARAEITGKHIALFPSEKPV